MMLTLSPTLRTSIVICAWGMSSLLSRLNNLTPSNSPRRAWSEPCSSSPLCDPPPTSGRPAQGALLVREDVHEVREAGDVEDLHVVFAQALGLETALSGARAGEQAHYKGDSGRVDVVHPLEVEDDSLQVHRLRLRVGRVESFLSEAVDLATEVEHGAAGFPAHLHLQFAHGHHLPPSALSSRCIT